MLQHSKIVELPEAFSAIKGLGTPLNYFPPRHTGSRVGLIAGIFLLLLGFSTLCLGIFVAWQESVQHGVAVVPGAVYMPIVFSVILFLASFAAFLYGFTRQKASVAVFEHGFASQTKDDMKEVRWEEIDMFYIDIRRRSFLGIPLDTLHGFTVELSNNEELIFDDSLSKISELGQLIQQYTTPLRYEKAADEFNQNKEINFGPFLLTQSELQYKENVIPLENLSDIRVEKGTLQLSVPTGRISVRIASIPNLAVFLAVLQQVCGNAKTN